MLLEAPGIALISRLGFVVDTRNGGTSNRSASAPKDPSAIMPPRKRRRSVAFAPTDDDNTSTREVDSPSGDAPPAEETANPGVWDAFREEYHEGIVHFTHRPRH